MVGGGLPPRSDKPSIKYRYTPLEGAFLELADFDREEYAPSSSDNNKQNGKKSEPKCHDILSTSELISAVGQIWDCATHPLSVFQPKTTSKHDNGDLQKGNMFCYPAEEKNFRASTSPEDQYFSVDLVTTGRSSSIVQANLEHLKVTQKMSFFEPYSGSHIYSLIRRFLQSGSNNPIESCKEEGLASIGISYDFRNVYYGWMNEITIARLKHQSYCSQIGNKETDEYTAEDTSAAASCCISSNTTSLANNLITGKFDCHTEMTKHLDSSSFQNAKSIENTSASITSPCSDYFLEPVQDIEANGSISRIPISRLCADYLVSVLASDNSAYAQRQQKIEEDDLYESKEYQQKEFVVEDKSKEEIFSSTQNKPRYALAKQEHAFAGAFAGIFVSVCLHPVDTIKTVTQSCRSDQKSIHYISRSIISERGVTGLYRGIASNIACSAPISAVYTFTYESVKGALLPLFAKEYHSLAHCVAGGCASIATSFIFTPSERIKQQMQVGSHYQNCWKALIGIVRKGGLSSLYAGWGAVLCRNVPHSIIKFYTYENLKQLMLTSLQSNAQPTTLLTLVSGGLAGSTAALFTTPFDVVKTRLQTQIPGSMNQYDGVFNTLKEIAKHEGLKGLYRGLTPRLVMYMTQGALFFTSYESFKRLFSPEFTQLNAPTIQCKPKVEDELTSLSNAA